MKKRIVLIVLSFIILLGIGKIIIGAIYKNHQVNYQYTEVFRGC